MHPVKTGLDNFLVSPPDDLDGMKLGLLCNPASVNRRFQHARDLINARFPGQLAALFSPQHGFYAEKQDNMIESADIRDPVLDIPVYSLYGETRVPTPAMLADIDVLLVDIQDVGTRVYTFIYTMSYCMEKAKESGKRVIVLDRPNPVGGVAVEGNCLDPGCASFVGRYPMPMRHGLTIGEVARLFNQLYGIGCDLTVIPMQGWRREMMFVDTGLPWVPPSPNLPTPSSAMVYPGQVLWEGTNVSEGRGTTQPFELFGAPFIDGTALLNRLKPQTMEGLALRPVVFEPTANKWCGKRCAGFQVHVLDPRTYNSYGSSLRLLEAVLKQHPDSFRWKSPPYEYEFFSWPIDLITGDKIIRQRLENGDAAAEIEREWQSDLAAFRVESRPVLMY